jgi:glycerophosphoryl diester phosphodiesterase
MPSRIPQGVAIRGATDDIRVIGHRGATGYAPENTLAAFRMGAALGADWVETDVKPTADGALVLLHDHTVDRTTDGSGPVAGLTLAQVRALDAGSWFAPEYAGEQVPTLEDLLAWAVGRVGVCLDLGGGLPAPALERLGALVAASGWAHATLVLAGDMDPLVRLKRLCPQVSAGILYRADPEGVLQRALRQGIDFLHPNRHLLSPVIIDAAHAAGLPVAASVDSDAAWIRERIAWGLDIVNCDHPDLPRKALKGEQEP